MVNVTLQQKQQESYINHIEEILNTYESGFVIIRNYNEPEYFSTRKKLLENYPDIYTPIIGTKPILIDIEKIRNKLHLNSLLLPSDGKFLLTPDKKILFVRPQDMHLFLDTHYQQPKITDETDLDEIVLQSKPLLFNE